MNVGVLLYAPALAFPGMTTGKSFAVVPLSAAKSRSPCPEPAAVLSIVAAVVLSARAALAVGPAVAGLPAAAVVEAQTASTNATGTLSAVMNFDMKYLHLEQASFDGSRHAMQMTRMTTIGGPADAGGVPWLCEPRLTTGMPC